VSNCRVTIPNGSFIDGYGNANTAVATSNTYLVDTQFYHKVDGVVTVGNKPALRTIILFDHVDNRSVGWAMTDPVTGAYSATARSINPVYVLCPGEYGQENQVIGLVAPYDL